MEPLEAERMNRRLTGELRDGIRRVTVRLKSSQASDAYGKLPFGKKEGEKKYVCITQFAEENITGRIHKRQIKL